MSIWMNRNEKATSCTLQILIGSLPKNMFINNKVSLSTHKTNFCNCMPPRKQITLLQIARYVLNYQHTDVMGSRHKALTCGWFILRRFFRN